MAGTWNHHELRAGDSLCNQVGVPRRNQPVRLAVDHECRSDDLVDPAVGLPAENSLQLRRVTLWARKPWPAIRKVFIYPCTRSRRSIDKRYSGFSRLLATHLLPPHQYLNRF